MSTDNPLDKTLYGDDFAAASPESLPDSDDGEVPTMPRAGGTYVLLVPACFYGTDPDVSRYLNTLQMLVNRMATSAPKYGDMCDKYPDSATGIGMAQQRTAMYEASGNTENCLDAANGLLIEYLFPSHPKAHLCAQEPSESPGIAWKHEG